MKFSLPVPTQLTLMMYQTPPLLKGERGEAMKVPYKKGYQVTLPCPQLTAIPDEIGECIAQDALLVKNLGWEGFVRESLGRGDFCT